MRTLADRFAVELAESAAQCSVGDSMDVGFASGLLGRARTAGESLLEPIDCVLAFNVGASNARGGAVRSFDGGVDWVGRPANDRRVIRRICFDCELQACRVGGEIVFDGEHEAAVGGGRVFAEDPGGAGGGDEGQAAHGTVDGGAFFFAEVTD